MIQQYVENIDKVENLHTFLQNDVVDRKLVVFIDDLDRCSIENTLNILESLKIFLSIRNSIFVVGADIEKLERAWELRYNKTMTKFNESKSHIDKIFQLSINLPQKDNMSLSEFLEKLKVDKNIFDSGVCDLIVNGSRANPRSLKRTINLTNILWSLGNKRGLKVNDKKILISIAILCIQYPQLLKIIKKEPKVFFELAFLTINYDTHVFMNKYKNQVNELDHYSKTQENKEIKTMTMSYQLSNFSAGTIEGLKYLLDNENAFNLMRRFGMNYSYHGAKSERILDVETERRSELTELQELLRSTSLFV